MKKKKAILSDHDRVGKRFRPPMLRVGSVKGISLGKNIIPEFIWIALLNYTHGWKRGAQLALDLARSAAVVTGVEVEEFTKQGGVAPKQQFATLSAYADLTETQKLNLVDNLKESLKLDPLISALAPLVAFYPRCPLAFLFEGPPLNGSEDQLNQLRLVIKPLYDKYSKPAVRMFGNAVYIALCTNKLRVLEGSLLSKVPVLEFYPDTDESRGVAAATRAAEYSLLRDTPPDWANYFWNRGLEIAPCDYDEVVNNDGRRIMGIN